MPSRPSFALVLTRLRTGLAQDLAGYCCDVLFMDASVNTLINEHEYRQQLEGCQNRSRHPHHRPLSR